MKSRSLTTLLLPAPLPRAPVALAVVLAFAASAAATGKDVPHPAEPGKPDAYAAIVALYRAGHADAAIAELGRWRTYDIEAAVEAVRERPGWFSKGVPGEDGNTGAAAVLLHADAALLAWARYAQVEHELHLRLALQLTSWLRNEERSSRSARDAASITSRELYVSLAAAELSVMSVDGATLVTDEALRSHARDPELLLLAGVAQEMCAITFAHAGRAREEAEALRRAQKQLGAAQAAAPDFETRLRLGYVWARRGRTIEAQQLLESAQDAAQEPRQKYLAALFLGRVHELRHHPELAAQAYRRALEQEPRGQAARIALAHVVETTAGPEQARPLVLETLAASPREDWSADPWWGYYFGPPELRLEPLARLRRRVRLP